MKNEQLNKLLIEAESMSDEEFIFYLEFLDDLLSNLTEQ